MSVVICQQLFSTVGTYLVILVTPNGIEIVTSMGYRQCTEVTGIFFFDGWKEEYSGSKFPLLYLGFIPEKVWKCRWEGKERQELALSWGRGNGRGRNALRPGSGLPRRSAGSGAVA